MTLPVRVQSAPFDMGAELNRFAARVPGAGAVVSFSGLTRDLASGDLQVMEIEHYPGMTEAALAAIRDEAIARFCLTDAMILHRFGPLRPADPIMMVATAARHLGPLGRGITRVAADDRVPASTHFCAPHG